MPDAEGLQTFVNAIVERVYNLADGHEDIKERADKRASQSKAQTFARADLHRVGAGRSTQTLGVKIRSPLWPIPASIPDSRNQPRASVGSPEHSC